MEENLVLKLKEFSELSFQSKLEVIAQRKFTLDSIDLLEISIPNNP